MDTESEDIAVLVDRARSGDQDAWCEIVRRYGSLVWSVARAHRLDTADAADVAQHTWTALAEQLHRLRQPERVAGWLATTARRESLRLIAMRRRELPVDWTDGAMEPVAATRPAGPMALGGPEPAALRADRDRALWRAFASLPDSCRALLGLLAHAPELTYAQLGRALGIKVGSIGQTRGRCLAVLRRRLAMLDVRRETAG